VNIGPDTLVIDDEGKPVEPGSGKIGRIARSGNVPLRYHKDPEKTAATFITIDGVRYSIPGDFARVEEDGSVTLLGRGSNCINSGGEKIFPEEVEGALKSHPDVFDAIVVGVPDERFGSRVAAVVQPRPGKEPTLDELDAHVRKHIAGYKVPRELHLVDEMRRQPSGKPDYPWAQEYALKARANA
jgi:acyl-CoA synthetase (AMP-forming)/AMP-acid ligase II